MTLPSAPPIGKKFGRLTVVCEVDRRRKPSGATIRFMQCECDCGNKKEVALEKLRNGETQSCGCLHVERTIQASTRHGFAKKHASRSKEYNTWAHIKQRCTNPNNRSFKDYGGRGISMFQGWADSFELFLSDVGEAPDGSDVSIDRIDNDRGYEPGNVRWSTRSIQNSNKRTNVYVQFEGRSETLTQISRRLGIDEKQLWHRYRVKKLPIELCIQGAKKCS